MNPMRNPMRSRGALAALLALVATTACVPVSVDEVAGVDCVAAAECSAERACVAGRCVACGPEVCDGFDNDCDGRVDEDFNLATSRENCGSCGAMCEGECFEGICSAPDASTCEPATETCDGVDNDCDGEIDEGFEGLGDTCEVGLGACREEAVTVCSEDGARVVCPARARSPEPEICGDGIDNDCDGDTDEGFADLGEDCVVGVGACEAAGEVICDLDAPTTSRCSASPGAPTPEVCNGVDDDCDGTVDEGVVNACGACGPAPEERCDGADNDCDGEIDEGFDGVGEPCSAGVGACLREAVQICSEESGEVVCPVSAGAPGDEICGNEIDDDCDGTVDEGFDDLGAECQAGVGACQVHSERVCSPDRLSTVCGAQPLAPRPETCNFIDDDCDGEVDENFDLQSDLDHCGTCQNACVLPGAVPACRAGDCVIIRCEDGFEDQDGSPDNGCECNRLAPDEPDPEGVDSNCDGVDGDANRSVFVSARHGNAGAAGTIDSPVASLADALARVTADRPYILLDSGQYTFPEGATLNGTVSIHGGYDHDPSPQPPRRAWERPGAGAEPRLEISALSTLRVAPGARVVFDRVHLARPSPPLNAQAPLDAIGVVADRCERIVLRDVQMTIADARDGRPGRAPVLLGNTAEPGTIGGIGNEVGEGGSNPVCRVGTRGGNGGVGTPRGVPGGAGDDGDRAPGSGGVGEIPPDQPALDGRDADAFWDEEQHGADGDPGPPIGAVDVVAGIIERPLGSGALEGAPGPGGGGGGGAAGNADLPRFVAFTGSGGGAGGCGGRGGQNGSAGGSAVGILIVGACEIESLRSRLTVGRGGVGGAGSPGTTGGRGAVGGPRNVDPVSNRSGGGGGRGADGGCGGDGAGAHGGHSIGVLVIDRAPGPLEALPEIQISAGGAPGSVSRLPACNELRGSPPPAPHGVDGVAAEIACCASLDPCVPAPCGG